MNRLNERAELMGRMLETMGAMKHVPSGVQADMAMRSAAFRCISCTQTEACRKWLDSHPEGARKALPQCPNAPLFNSWTDSSTE
ncbi:DUF6455 family protein [Roseibium salinum]|uniref:DUF6455 family protein n=1 Tax=Roseibium salinum TaxID=1604349 RepID=A0ABT3R2F3_9HYPH|nr:DUF6455 family protein [Roseibium sp. DSM 29163]MCX2723388.1 DUF6455 family protein [Roseibium sp. DSM 29163]